MSEKISKAESDESFEVKSKTLRPLKAIAKTIGIMLVFFGFFVLVVSYAVTYLIDADPDTIETIFTIAFTVGTVFLGGGVVLCASVSILTLPNEYRMDNYLNQYFKDKEKPERSIRFFSFRWGRLIPAILFLILGFLDLFILTGAIGHEETPFGDAVVFGGPSFYYTVAFFPHAFGLGLLLYTFFYSHKADIAKSENYFYYNEFKKNSTVSTTIAEKNIELISYQNNHIGKNHAWIITLIPFIVLTFINGVYIVNAPLLTNPIQGILMIITAIIEIPILIFLVLRPSHYFKITTKENQYETWFYPHKRDISEIPLSGDKGIGKVNAEFMSSNDISSTHKSYTNLLLGLFFMIFGTLMISYYWVLGVFGGLFTMGAIIFGTILVFKAIAFDFSKKDGVLVDYDMDSKLLHFRQDSRYHFLEIETHQPTDLKVTNQFRRLTVFDLVIIPIILIFSMIETVQSWAITIPATLWNSVITTIFLVLVYFLIFYYICSPTDQLHLKTPTLQNQVPITLTSGKNGHFKGVLSEDLKKGFLVRCLYVLGIGITTLIYTIIYLNLNFFV